MSDEPNPLDDAELIAYLDGELGAPEAQVVEAKLALDPVARSKATALKKTFDLLDFLPKPEPSVDFTTRTLTKLQPIVSGQSLAAAVVTPSLSGSALTTSHPALVATSRFGWLGGIVWLAAAILAALGGYTAHLALRPYVDSPPRDSEMLFTDTLMIRSLPLYLGVDDLEYLKSLNEPDLFAPDPVVKPLTASADKKELVSTSTEKQLSDLFKKFPTTRQQQLRELDQRLQDLPASERDQLGYVLESYAVWLDRLPDSDRKEVLVAASSDARLEKVRLLRNKQWRESHTTTVKKRLANAASEEERDQVIESLKNGEAARRDQWSLARRQWELHHGPDRKNPWPFSDPVLTKQVDEYIKAVFKADLNAKFEPKSDAMRLTREEFSDLKMRQEAAKKEGDWSLYGLLLYQLAERHPYLPEPGTGKPLVEMPPLTQPFLKEARSKGFLPKLEKRQLTRGKWPEFALELAEEVKRAKLTVPFPFGPCRPGEFTEPVNAFLKESLLPQLDSNQIESLKKLEGKWPEYPKLIISLSRLPKIDLPIPGVTLPGQPSLWVKYYQLQPTGK